MLIDSYHFSNYFAVEKLARTSDLSGLEREICLRDKCDHDDCFDLQIKLLLVRIPDGLRECCDPQQKTATTTTTTGPVAFDFTVENQIFKVVQSVLLLIRITVEYGDFCFYPLESQNPLKKTCEITNNTQ